MTDYVLSCLLYFEDLEIYYYYYLKKISLGLINNDWWLDEVNLMVLTMMGGGGVFCVYSLLSSLASHSQLFASPCSDLCIPYLPAIEDTYVSSILYSTNLKD